ncbi:MAG TPA: ATP-binding cassette domain-containing protein [Desulfobacterales bacterium]|nr:ATP-binding cassette domain-containing protein [Desulfobacterales bacterium]
MQIELEKVSKSWGDVQAVDQVSFTAPAGELVVVLGPSGCGKSTVLRLIAGLETVSAGAIRIEGRDVTGLPPAKRNLSMVFQSYALFPHLSVAENIVFGLKVRKLAAAERQRRLERAMELLGLQGLLLRKPAELSGGQRQRVALGRAIVSEAPVCLMDEPLSNLDAKLRHEMRREIRTLQQRLGITMIYVTHDQVEAMTMADKIVLLNAGRVEQFAPPEELYARPATVFAAGFIGTPPMNLLPLDNADVLRWARANLAGCLPQGVLEGLIVGVRPEKISLADVGLAADVLSLEYLGADSLVACRIGECELIVRQSGRVKLAAGDRIHMTWPQAESHFFEARSGRRHAG